MAAWTHDELNRIGEADELQIASLRRDGTLRNPVTIWVVRHGEGLYVRAVRGRENPWFRGALTRHEGRIWAGGLEKDVTFEDVSQQLVDELDAVYRTKYQGYPDQFVNAVVDPESRDATIKLVPRTTRS